MIFSVSNVFRCDMVNFITRILSLFIFNKQQRRKFRDYMSLLFSIKEDKLLKNLRNKVKHGSRVKVGFLVVFDSVFQSLSLFEKMLQDDLFEPFIIVIPDVCRGKDNQMTRLSSTYVTLSSLYSGYVFKGYDENTDTYVDFSGKMDIAVFNNPYDGMTHDIFGVKYLRSKVLTVFVNYFYCGKLKQELDVIKSIEFSSFWKVFLENDISQKIVTENSIRKGKNTYVSGYVKMDGLSNVIQKHLDRKKIIIAPHHTVKNIHSRLALSNFLRYADFILNLPNRYPDVDFVFRPHPLLFIHLLNYGIWTQRQIDKYIDRIKMIPNILYQSGGEYFDVFVNSDALIHDCGSFLAEYFYTGKPQCFCLRQDKELSDNFTDNGINMLSYVYKALNEEDITKFIDEVVVNQMDYMHVSRLEYATKNLMINYPNASVYALEHIKKQLF